METRSLHSLLKQVRNELEWPVLEQPHGMPVVRIVSYPRDRSHVILTPEQASKQYNAPEYLHELGHAILCERSHPVFSASASFAPRGNKRLFMVLHPALNVACDWFVGEWQMGVAPELTRRQIEESLPVAEEILAQATLPPLEIILDAAMVIAQAIHYLEEPIECEGVLQTAVQAFLSVPPGEPSAEACVGLVNRLMATYTDQRARLVCEEGVYAWEVVEAPEAEQDYAPMPNALAGTA